MFTWKAGIILILMFGFMMQALLYSPLNASTLTCMGLVYSLSGNISEAVETLHKSLGIRRNDSFTTTLLNSVIELLVDQEEPFEGNIYWMMIIRMIFAPEGIYNSKSQCLVEFQNNTAFFILLWNCKSFF